MGTLVRKQKWLPDKNGVFFNPKDILLSDLSDTFEKDSVEAKSLTDKLGLKKDILQQLFNAFTPEQKKRFELAEKIPLEKLEELAAAAEPIIEDKLKGNNNEFNYGEELKRLFNKSQLIEKEIIQIDPSPVPNPALRRDKIKEEINEAKINKPVIIGGIINSNEYTTFIQGGEQGGGGIFA